MELPIRIIIVLFVTLVVAGALLMLARNVIDNAQLQLRDFGEVEPEKIIDKGGADVHSSEIVYLAFECYNRGQESQLKDNLCFVVTGNIIAQRPEMESKGLDTLPNYDSNLVEDVYGAGSLGIYYNPLVDTVEIKRW
jgi:hypothetical protein